MRTVSLAAAIALAACQPRLPSPVVASAAGAPVSGLLAEVPADTPYVIASLDGLDDSVLARFRHQFDSQLAKAAAASPSDTSELAQATAILTRVLQEAKQGHDTWASALGLSASGRFVLYGMSVWPVLRLEISDGPRLHAFVAHALAELRPVIGPVVEAVDEGSQPYWRVDLGKAWLVATVLPHEAVIALEPKLQVPVAAAPAGEHARPPSDPHPLWNVPVSYSLAGNRTLEKVQRDHGFQRSFIGYVDTQRVVAILTGRSPHDRDLFPADTLGIPAACDADLDRLAALVPRVAFGYHRLDATSFSASLVAELPLPMSLLLRKLRAAVPGVTARAPAGALGSLGIAIDGDAVVGVLSDVAALIAARPFTCDALTSLNTEVATAASQLSQALPPMLRGLRGGLVVITNATKEPVTLTGHALIVSDHAADLVNAVFGRLGFGGTPLAGAGVPVPLPVSTLGLSWFSSAHVLVAGDRVVLAFGDDSAHAVLASAHEAPPAHSPFMTLSYDFPRLRASFPEIADKLASMETLGNVMMSLDLRDDGLHLDVEDADMPASP